MVGKHWLKGTLNLYGLKLSFQVDKVNILVKRSIVNIVKRMFSFHSWEGCDFCPCLGYVTIFIPNSPPPPEVHFATFVCVTVMPRHFADLTIPLFFAKSRFLRHFEILKRFIPQIFPDLIVLFLGNTQNSEELFWYLGLSTKYFMEFFCSER